MRYGTETVKRVTPADRVLDDLVNNFKVHVKLEFEKLRVRYHVPAEYDLGVACKHVEGGYSDITYRITSGAVTIRRKVSLDTLDSAEKSGRMISSTIMDICRTFAQQFGRVR